MVCTIRSRPIKNDLRSDDRAQGARENERVCFEAVFVLTNGVDSGDAALVCLTGVLDGKRGRFLIRAAFELGRHEGFALRRLITK